MDVDQISKAQYSAPALENALKIIDFMARQEGESYGINELSRLLGITNNMTYRIMCILSENKYVQTDAAGKYRLGSKLFSIGIKLKERINLKNCVRPWLDELCKKTGEVSHVQIYDGSRCLLTDSVSPDADFYFYVKPGSRLFYHANAFGKAMLAFLDEERFKIATSEGLVRLTSHTATNFKTLNAMLDQTRRCGIAYDLEEYNSGIYCVGAPVFDVMGEAAAGVGIIGFVSSLGEGGCAVYNRPVLECAEKISLCLGYSGDLFKKWLVLPENDGNKI